MMHKRRNSSETRHVTSCGTCIFRENGNSTEILLVRPQEKYNTWGVPKGHMELGETYEETALRETKEETGLDVVLLAKLPNCLASYDNEKKTVVTFLAKIIDEDQPIIGDGENFEILWFDVQQLPRIHRYQEKMIAAAVESIKLLSVDEGSLFGSLYKDE